MRCIRYFTSRFARNYGRPNSFERYFYSGTFPSLSQTSTTTPISTTDDSENTLKQIPKLGLINKTLYDTTLKCNRLGWYARRGLLPLDNDMSPMREFLSKGGIEFEKYVYSYEYGYNWNNEDNCTKDDSFSKKDGVVFIHERSPAEASKITISLMQQDDEDDGVDNAAAIILQPTFLAGNLIARADAAIRDPFENNVWEIIEIKMSTDKSYEKKIRDLAFTVHVARTAGFKISKSLLIMTNSKYIQKSDNSNSSSNIQHQDDDLLYTKIDCTDLVDSFIIDNDMDHKIDSVMKITGEEVKDVDTLNPPTLFGIKNGLPLNQRELIKHGIWELPRLSQKRFTDILKNTNGSFEMEDIHLDLDATMEDGKPLLTKNQKTFFESVLQDNVIVDHTLLQKSLNKIQGLDVKYLDFEAVTMLHPPFMGMSPYEVMVTQYSLHSYKQKEDLVVEGEMEQYEELLLSHSEYLADHERDCREELLIKLMADLGYLDDKENADHHVDGSILVYSSYEKTQLQKLALTYPHYKKQIQDIIHTRLVDLEKIIKECVSHPEFRGRSSIKVTLPTLVPGFEHAYTHLSQNSIFGIADGGSATVAYAEMIMGRRSGDDVIQQTKTALLEYCKLDTLALVEIHRALRNLVGKLD